MLSPEKAIDVTEHNLGLEHWLDRACGSKARDHEYHLTYRGAVVTVAPSRVAMVEKDGRYVRVDGEKGRGWCPAFAKAVEAAIDGLDAGGGEPIRVPLGQVIRDEIVRRNAGGQRPVSEREHWVEWLEKDELPLLLGSWLHKKNILGAHMTVSRAPALGFYPTNEEFEMGAIFPSVMFPVLRRLADARCAAMR
jgi:hypothetical protein